MLDKLSIPFEEYYTSSLLEKMEDYFADICGENWFEVYELALALRKNSLSEYAERIIKDFGSPDDTTGEDVETIMNRLQKLIDELKKNEEEFYKDVLNSDNPNFLITSYYSLYLRFVELLHSKLRNIEAKDSRVKDTISIVNFLVGFLGIPILIYIKKKEVITCISELSGALLHVIVSNRTPIPSKDSLGYYLFSKIHADNS